MNRTKLYVSAALFLFITVFKLSAPGAATDLRQQLLPMINHDTDYTQTVKAIGEQLGNGEDEPDVGMSNDIASEPSMPQLMPIGKYIEEEYPVIHESLYAADSRTYEEPEVPIVEDVPPAEPASVTAFLESQQQFSGYAIPETVSYDYQELPFAFVSPVAGMTSSGFGYRLHPIYGEVRFHYGTDFAAWTGTPIYAFADGVVRTAGNSDSYGLYLILDHGNGWSTLYAHCSQLNVSQGAAVIKGQEVALAGETGQVTGPHLHFELTCGNIYFNPEYYINAQ